MIPWWRVLVLVSGTACAAVALPPDPSRPVLVAAGAAGTACLVAAVGRWRLAGTLAVTLVTATVLLADVLDSSVVRPVQTVLAGVLLLVLLTALERNEEPSPAVTVLRPPLARRLGAPALAVAAASLVAVTAAQDVVPSVATVVAGLLAAVAALAVATRVHRN